MITNESTADRAIRVVLGVAGIGAGFAVGISGVAGIVLAGLGAVLLVTGAVGFCPLYRLFGISTCPLPSRD